MLTKKDYCDLKTVKELESLGMNIYTSFNGVDVVKNILLYEAQKWLREEKKIDLGAGWDNDENAWYLYIRKMGFPN